MKIVGLTGGIGSGKSTVARMFIELGVPVYFADLEAKLLMNTSSDLVSGVKNLFGEKAYLQGKLNREYIASIVFKDKKKLELLNQLVHPAVQVHFKDWVNKQSGEYVLQENALIFEKNAVDRFDKIITVTADQQTRIERVMSRDGASEKQVLERMANQLNEAIKISGADYVIHNNSLETTRRQVSDIHKALLG